VIKTLEGLTGVHLDMEILGLEEDNDTERDREKDDDGEPERAVDGVHEEEREVAKALLLANGNGVARASNNGSAKAADKKKIDWEIPRKVLHSSIGTYLSLILFCSF
jgi:diacylglycerol kinase (CTP)